MGEGKVKRLYISL